jgi:hypothetical protein
MTLRALQSSADNQGTVAPMTWKALNSVDSQLGAPNIDYRGFSDRWDAEGEKGILHQLVSKFDGAGLVVKTNEKEPMPRSSHKERELTRMAKRATHKHRKFD